MRCEMRDIVLSRAHRTLRRMARYKPLSDDLTTMHQYIKGVSLQEDEAIIGVYENMPGASDESIIITDFGIHILRGGRWEFIGYDQIDRIEGPPSKQNAEGLIAHLAD